MDSEIGTTLQRAREGRGLDLEDAQRATKIRARYLRALEREAWDELPGRAAARGFLSTYAHYLGLDEGPLLDAYSRGPGHTDAVGRLPEDMLPQPGALKGRARWPGVAVVLGSIAILAAGILVLTVPSGSDEPPSAPSAPEASAPQDRAATGDDGGGGAPDDAATKAEKRPDATQGSSPESGSSRSAVEVRASGEVWVCLLSGRGRALVDGETLAGGDSRGPFERRSFEAAFGNGSVRLEVNGERVKVPPSADPIGYKIGPRGVAALEGNRPDCL